MIALYIQINIFSRDAKIANVAKSETLKFSVKEVDKVQISIVNMISTLTDDVSNVGRTLVPRQSMVGEWLQMGRRKTVIGVNIVK